MIPVQIQKLREVTSCDYRLLPSEWSNPSGAECQPGPVEPSFRRLTPCVRQSTPLGIPGCLHSSCPVGNIVNMRSTASNLSADLSRLAFPINRISTQNRGKLSGISNLGARDSRSIVTRNINLAYSMFESTVFYLAQSSRSLCQK